MPALLSDEEDEDQVIVAAGDQEASADNAKSNKALDSTALHPVVVALTMQKAMKPWTALHCVQL